jgi:hypothetical protein
MTFQTFALKNYYIKGCKSIINKFEICSWRAYWNYEVQTLVGCNTQKYVGTISI